MSILIIDDEDDVRDSLKALLEVAGHSVITASSGAEGLERLKTDNIKLMLVDFSMPGMSGEEFIQKAWREKQSPPALVITGVAPWRTLGLIELGVGYVRKPINGSLLLGTIDTYLSKGGRDECEITRRVADSSVDGGSGGCASQG